MTATESRTKVLTLHARTAADLMTDMYRYITVDGYSVATALSAAMRVELVRTPSLDPGLWGPFAVYVAGD